MKPDLIIANKEENAKEDIELLSKDFPVWVSDIYDFNDALAMIRSIGEITNRAIAANTVADKIKREFEDIRDILGQRRVIYLIWKDPMMAVGKKTFINSMLEWCGLENIVKADRYPLIAPEFLDEAQIVLLSTEPYPFKGIHIKELQNIAPKPEFRIIDGEMFSWYGSHLMYFPDYIRSISKDLMSFQK